MKTLNIFSLLTCLVAVTAAYDFQDFEFNQILASDLEDVYTSAFAHPRVRREANFSEEDRCRPKRGKPLCCGEDIFKKPKEDDKDLKRACFKEVTGKDKPEGKPDRHHGPHFGGPPFDPFNCDKVQQFRNDMMCIEQCVGQKQNIIDSDGKLKQEDFEKFVKDMVAKQPALSPIADKVIAGCLEEVKNVSEMAQKNDSEATCKPVGIALHYCIFKHVQLNCPEDQIKDKGACMRFQDKLKRGRDALPGGPPGPEGYEQ